MPARDPELAAVLRKPFAEQVAFFRQKLGRLVPTARWDDLWQDEHDRAFMVAGAAKADLLADLAAAVDKAIADGETLDAFRKRFAEIVERRGWHGWTGEETEKGRAWRTRVIYETNLITSYAAGRYAQLKEGGYEYWIYKHSDFVQRPRPHHVALDGLTLRADDPFWQTHYPPNGWGCRCRVVGARGMASIRRVGGDIYKQKPGWVGEIDPRTGAPVGIDKGFAYPPGASVVERTRRAVEEKARKLPRQLANALTDDTKSRRRRYWDANTAVGKWHEASFANAPGYIKRAIRDRLDAALTVKEISDDASYYDLTEKHIALYTLNRTETRKQAAWRHEIGHHLDHMLGGGFYFSRGQRFTEAMLYRPQLIGHRFAAHAAIRLA